MKAPRFVVLGILIVTGILIADATWAVPANPLENAYWRFEEGTAGTVVPEGPNTVLDSINANHMQRWTAPDPPTDRTAPWYTTDVPAAIIPQTGEPNLLALDFQPNPTGGDDLFTTDGVNIQNPLTEAITVEASFKMHFVGSIEGLDPFQGIVCKEAWGQSPDLLLPIFVIKVRDTGVLQVELFDANGVIRNVATDFRLAEEQWYHVATVNDGTTLSMYLDSNDGNGYVLIGTSEVAGGPLWQRGILNDLNSNWTIGRAEYSGFPADWSDAVIDEVRISNRALDPSEFLFAAPAPKLAVVGIEELPGDVVRVTFENTGEPAAGYGLAVSEDPAGPFVEDPTAVITDLGGGVVRAEVAVGPAGAKYYKGIATP